jgi:hypothetical protein
VKERKDLTQSCKGKKKGAKKSEGEYRAGATFLTHRV